MKGRTMKILRMMLTVAVACPGVAAAYPQYTHQQFSRLAIERSLLNDQSSGVLEALGLGEHVDDRQYLLPSTLPFSWTLTPRRLVQYGAHQEDEGERALNHFFDLQLGGIPLTLLGLEVGHRSPDWSLEDVGAIGEQVYSLQDAKGYLKAALTSPSSAARDLALGRTFETLGHVIHHVQDMAQPQHVRNDDHCDQYRCLIFYKPSAYEAFIFGNRRELDFGGYPAADYSTFFAPRRFWDSNGRGIAEFTGNNFVSIRSNFRGTLDDMETDGSHPLPFPPGRAGVVEENIEDLLGPAGPGQPLQGTIWFISTFVEDQYDPARSRQNPRTSTVSLFESDLRSYGVYPSFSLNRFNYQAAAEFLLPRAVGYSTGVIDYFFRGRIEILPPTSGVYSVLDHGTVSAAGDGFTKLKVKLRNATPDGVAPGGSGPLPAHQDMSNGTLTAIAKYIVNPCYQPDLLGEYNGSEDFSGAITWNGCTLLEYFGGVEEIAISAERVGESLDRDSAREVEFDFSANPIPIDAHDLSLQIVYDGVLGSERDALVVSGTNLSEPTYLSVINGSDYYGIDNALYSPEEIRADDELSERVGNDNIDPEPLLVQQIRLGGQTVAMDGMVPAKGLLRIAVLADTEVRTPLQGPEPIDVQITRGFASRFLETSSHLVSPIHNQLARSPAVVSEIALRRGIPGWFQLYVYKALFGHTAPPGEDFEALGPMDPSCNSGGQWVCAPLPEPVNIVW